MFYIYSRSRCAFIAGIHFNAFEFNVHLTDDTNFAMECDFGFITWLRMLDSIKEYDIVPLRVCSDG